MNVNNAEEDTYPSKSRDDAENPRKKMRVDNSGHKVWRLMDRRTDHEVLQEMGVSLLEPDDGEPLCDTPAVLQHKPAKRKHDQENLNPNVNLVMSPKGKSPRSPLKACSPSPGPSCVKSPRSAEKHKTLRSSELLETIIAEHFTDEETPLAQVSSHFPPSNSAYTKPDSVTSSGGRSCYTPLGREDELILSKRCRIEPEGEDSFSALSDEMLLSVFRWLPKRTLAHCMLVCKRWYRVACDETLWQRLDLGNKTLTKDALGRILARKPVIVRLANSEIGEWHPQIALPISRIQYLDLSTVSTDKQTLNNLLQCCPHLKKLSLESCALDENTCRLVGQCSNLETLNLSMASGITSDGLDHMLEGCDGLQSLNIGWCGLSSDALEVLVNKLPQRLHRLNVSGSRIMTDAMVETLVARCPFLVELDLSDCSRLTATSISLIRGLTRLEHLALSRCYLLPPHGLTTLNSMPALQYLEVWGMLKVASLAALRAALPHLQLNKFMFSAIARPTVGTRRTSIWGLRTRD